MIERKSARAHALLAMCALFGCGGGDVAPLVDGGPREIADGGPDAGHAADGGGSSPEVVRLVTYVDGVAIEPGSIAWVAGRDGEGLWSPLESTDGVYELEVASGAWGFAWVCASEGGRLHFDFGTVAETTTIRRACRVFVPSTGSVSVSLSGLDFDDEATVFVHDDQDDVTQAAPTSSAFTVPERAHDAIAVIEAGGLSPSDIVIARDHVVTASPSTASLSLDDAMPLTTYALAASPVEAARHATFVSRSGTRATLNETGTAYGGLTSEQIEEGDMHAFSAEIPSVDHAIEAHAYRRVGGTVHLVLPEIPEDPIVYVPATVPSRLVELVVPTRADADLYYFIATSGTIRLEVTLTPGALIAPSGGFHALWIQPTLHYVTGWDASWGLGEGGFSWDLITIASTGDEADPFAYLGLAPPGGRGPRAEWDGDDVTITRAEGDFAP